MCSICETAMASSILAEEAVTTPSPSKKRTKMTPASCSARASHVTVDLTECEEQEECDEENSSQGGSEGGDDFHCTQIVFSEEDEDEDEDDGDQEEEVQLPPIEKATRPTPEPERQDPNQLTKQQDVCLICGVNLSKLKRRVDHIKRCSKKHNITGRDVKLNHDVEDFAPQQENKNRSVTANHNHNMNPYTKESDWHGEATIDLHLAEQDEPSSSSPSKKPTETTTQKQTSLSSFFQVPARSLNNVLLAGARRVSKFAEIINKPENKATGKRRSGGRGSFQRRDYSKVRLYVMVYAEPILDFCFLTRACFQAECPMYKKITGTDFVCDGFHYARR
jgi:hypothetical protein